MINKLSYLTVFLLMSILHTHAQLKLSSLISDNMVLQRNTEVKLWGKAKAGEKVTIITSWNKSKAITTSSENGDWMIKVKTKEAGGPYMIDVSSKDEKIVIKNILLGEVWLCSGQSNMEMPIEGFKDQPINGSNDALVDADNNDIRLFTVKSQWSKNQKDTCNGNWVEASAKTVEKFSAVAYFYAKQLQSKLKVPVGVISTVWGGSRIESWMSEETISHYPADLKLTSSDTLKPQYHAYYLYNGMIAPLLNVRFKGVLWYQGEANVPNYQDYAALLAGMVNNWRKDFDQGEFPFYYVQIAPYFYGNSNQINSALLREAQLKAQALITNVGMVTSVDLGEEKVIHTSEKLTVAKRLSYWALSETYGFKGIHFISPTYKSMAVKDSIAYLTFENTVNGLSSFGKEVESFEIAGEDRIFYPAKISTNRNYQVLVTSPKVKIPVAVRYNFYNFSQTKGFLYNTAGLPVPSFRTDNW